VRLLDWKCACVSFPAAPSKFPRCTCTGTFIPLTPRSASRRQPLSFLSSRYARPSSTATPKCNFPASGSSVSAPAMPPPLAVAANHGAVTRFVRVTAGVCRSSLLHVRAHLALAEGTGGQLRLRRVCELSTMQGEVPHASTAQSTGDHSH